MRQKRERQLGAVVMPLLRNGEQIEYMTSAQAGTVPRKKQLAVTLISTILTLGFVSVFVSARRYYLVLTNQRLIFFPVGRNSGAPVPTIWRQLPRYGLSAAPPRSRLGITFTISTPGNPNTLRLAFGQQQRKDANTLAAAIGSGFGVGAG